MGPGPKNGKAFFIEIFDEKTAIDRKKLLDRPAPKYAIMEIAASPRAKIAHSRRLVKPSRRTVVSNFHARSVCPIDCLNGFAAFDRKKQLDKLAGGMIQ